ncbi:type IV secretion system protein VirB5 [Brevundimonas nasdae]|uniref:conjugal transfer protein TrbF n=1 Tax=Brevundimonas nasdae TaxID=172043 RepID=UPI00191411D3|nr:conjugal transfer protein TrbF [Brevundimonas nasdae]MBK6025799.1 conjugal transfer protein TrbF [Brevundimonas nasdae]MDQ0452350.1 type IV secretion system protein VirB5 [Brevundimonas nasdae]
MTPFKRASAHYGEAPAPATPYQRAAQAWDERIGSARVQARNWRLIALVSVVTTGGLAAALVVQSARGVVTPWIVEVDHRGEATAVGPALAGARPDDAQIAWHLGRFIEQVRSVSADPVVVRENWLRAYDYATDAGAQTLSDHARRNDPFAEIGRVQVGVEISSVIRASPASFRVAWIERRYVDGQLSDTSRWTAIVTVTIQTPRTADALRRNPLGLYVQALNWSKELS